VCRELGSFPFVSFDRGGDRCKPSLHLKRVTEVLRGHGERDSLPVLSFDSHPLPWLYFAHELPQIRDLVMDKGKLDDSLPPFQVHDVECMLED
jgi:hypothetical protein